MSDIISTKKYFLEMIGAILCGQSVHTCPEDVEPAQLCRLASQNAVNSFLYLAVKDGKISVPEAVENALRKTYMTNLVRDVSQAEERDYIREKFNENNIDFMFLKGSHLKELYPAPEIRYMVDMDVLVQAKDLEKGRKILRER